MKNGAKKNANSHTTVPVFQEGSMRRVSLTVLICLVSVCSVFGQSFNGSISGVVRDPSQALIPGVTITVTNTQTGVVATRISNESGAYNVPSLIPGVYKVTADLPGFTQAVYNEVQLGTSAQIRLDFTLQVGGVTQSVEVSVASDSLLRESSVPIGPNKLLLSNSSGWLARLVERWQASVIVNMSTGGPSSFSAIQTLWANGRPDVVGPWNVRKGEVKWGTVLNAAGDLGGRYFGDGYMKVEDPACAPGGIADNTDALGYNLRGNLSATNVFTYVCTNDALADAKTGQILLRNAAPGTRGSLGSQTVEELGDWSFDGTMSKTFQIGEVKSLQVRVDAINVFNHPKPNDPTLDINGNNLIGTITGKDESARTFRGQVRFTF
jgi:hypothetical protein